MKYLLLLVFTALSLTMEAQEKSLISSSYGYSFFGTGDGSGSHLDIHYHRLMAGRLGVHTGLVHSSTSGLNSFVSEDILIQEPSILISGNGPVFSSMSQSKTVQLGLSYSVSHGESQRLIISGGLLYQSFRFLSLNYGVRSAGGDSPRIIDFRSQIISEQEVAPYLTMDYIYFLNDTFGLGVKLMVENSDSIVYHAGLSVNARF